MTHPRENKPEATEQYMKQIPDDQINVILIFPGLVCIKLEAPYRYTDRLVYSFYTNDKEYIKKIQDELESLFKDMETFCSAIGTREEILQYAPIKDAIGQLLSLVKSNHDTIEKNDITTFYAGTESKDNGNCLVELTLQKRLGNNSRLRMTSIRDVGLTDLN